MNSVIQVWNINGIYHQWLNLMNLSRGLNLTKTGFNWAPRLKSWKIEYNLKLNQPYLSRVLNLSRGSNSIYLASGCKNIGITHFELVGKTWIFSFCLVCRSSPCFFLNKLQRGQDWLLRFPLIPISLQSNVVDLKYFKLWILIDQII